MKIRVTRVSVAVIETDIQDYPEGVTEDNIVEFDKNSIEEDPSIMDDWLVDDEITVERIE
jgi:hypothetical protein